MTLYSDVIASSRLSTVAVVGMAKNCGKTTVLAAMIRDAAALGVRLGVTSAGRDGEAFDAVTGLAKPPIWLPTGALVVTAEDTLARSRAKLTSVCRTGRVTNAGELVAYEVAEPGNVEVIGPNHEAIAAEMVELLKSLGARTVFVDGAADRVFSAAPAVSQAVVLATGAALSENMDEVLGMTQATMRVLSLPHFRREALATQSQTIDGFAGDSIASEGLAMPGYATTHDFAADGCGETAASVRAAVYTESTVLEAMRELRIAAIDHDGRTAWFPGRTALGQADKVAAMVTGETRLLAIGRAAPGSLLSALVTRTRRLGIPLSRFEIVVKDPTRIAMDPHEVVRYLGLGGRISVLEPQRILALTVNPTSPYHPGFPAREFLAKASLAAGEVLPGLCAYDVVLGARAQGGVVIDG